MIHKFEQLYSSYNFPDVKGIGIIQNFISILASWCQNRYINIKEVILHHKENKDDSNIIFTLYGKIYRLDNKNYNG